MPLKVREMNYMLSELKNSNGIVSYENDISLDYTAFLEGIALGDINPSLYYTVKKESDVEKMRRFHMISSSGADLISDSFRAVIEKIASQEVEFFEPIIMFKDQKIQGFSAMNIKYRKNCLDLPASEFKLTNFDPSNPTYRFYYIVIDNHNLGANIVRCNEMGRIIVVSEQFKEACKVANLRNLVFSQTSDMTYNNRTIKEVI